MSTEIDGELVRKLRTVKSWSQEELGQISGLSARTIQRIETEGSGSLDSRRALASAFGLRPEDLLAGQPSGAGTAPDGDRTYVDRPRLGAGFGAWLGLGLMMTALAVGVSIMGVVVGVSARNPSLILRSVTGVLVPVALSGVSLYFLWAITTTTYRLSLEGLQVRYGLHHRHYQWDDFTSARWHRGLLPFRLTLQPVTRLSDVVSLERRDGGSALDLTPCDPGAFMRQLAELAPRLTGRAMA